MEADSALVRAYGAGTLDAVASVDLNLAPVVHPGNAEHYDAFRLNDSLKNLLLHQMRVCGDIRSHAFGDFADCLMEFGLPRISGNYPGHKAVEVFLCKVIHI